MVIFATILLILLVIGLYAYAGMLVTYILSPEVLNLFEVNTDSATDLGLHVIGFPIFLLYIPIKLLINFIKIRIKKYKDRYNHISQRQLRAIKLKKLNKHFLKW